MIMVWGKVEILLNSETLLEQTSENYYKVSLKEVIEGTIQSTLSNVLFNLHDSIIYVEDKIRSDK